MGGGHGLIQDGGFDAFFRQQLVEPLLRVQPYPGGVDDDALAFLEFSVNQVEQYLVLGL